MRRATGTQDRTSVPRSSMVLLGDASGVRSPRKSTQFISPRRPFWLAPCKGWRTGEVAAHIAVRAVLATQVREGISDGHRGEVNVKKLHCQRLKDR